MVILYSLALGEWAKDVRELQVSVQCAADQPHTNGRSSPVDIGAPAQAQADQIKPERSGSCGIAD